MTNERAITVANCTRQLPAIHYLATNLMEPTFPPLRRAQRHLPVEVLQNTANHSSANVLSNKRNVWNIRTFRLFNNPSMSAVIWERERIEGEERFLLDTTISLSESGVQLGAANAGVHSGALANWNLVGWCQFCCVTASSHSFLADDIMVQAQTCGGCAIGLVFHVERFNQLHHSEVQVISLLLYCEQWHFGPFCLTLQNKYVKTTF